jgi:hypothetical protein
MAQFIDRRLNSKGKSTLNRQRFLRRYKEQIKQSVADSVSRRSVTDIDNGEKISIPGRDVSEPFFHTIKGGKQEKVHPGNDHFSRGDKVNRPKESFGKGSSEGEASDSGEGEDEFIFHISKNEYLDLLFEDLALPNLQKNQLNKLVQYQTYRAGFVSDGVPSNLDVVRTLKGSIARRIAMTASKKCLLAELEKELLRLTLCANDHQIEIVDLKNKILDLKKRISKVPFIDTFDLRFRNFENRPISTSKAVMFCLMDVSGSMDQATKDLAKRFYILLYLFLTRSYKNVEVIYIRHHTEAKEVDEHDFFYSQETGGTIVSSALKLMQDIITERFPSSDWNIYAAQASDGDNWVDDSPKCKQILHQHLLHIVRYFTYIEITQRKHQSLWEEYKQLSAIHLNLSIKHIRDVKDIYPVFRELFHKSINK